MQISTLERATATPRRCQESHRRGCPEDWSYPPQGRHSPTPMRPRRPRARHRRRFPPTSAAAAGVGGGSTSAPPPPSPLILPPRTSASRGSARGITDRCQRQKGLVSERGGGRYGGGDGGGGGGTSTTKTVVAAPLGATSASGLRLPGGGHARASQPPCAFAASLSPLSDCARIGNVSLPLTGSCRPSRYRS